MTPLDAVLAAGASVPIQVDAEGSTAIALVIFLGQVIAFVLACWIGVRTYDGYRETGGSRPALYWLAVGIVLLAAVPTALRFVLPTFAGAGSLPTAVLATSSEIAGLAAILYAVFGRP